ncbi:unnamed protein product [Rhizoctonia solani]|uniref:Uncharacterized protein n=1 Tax=Rhizoctonia solani TaxID=456999 RepID=A0A8H3G9W1_9AGAM|nr:unnamed protein product [Rhizoctonia solani]
MPFFIPNLRSSDVSLDSISVVSQALLAFKEGTNNQSQDDVMSFLLLALLAASKKRSAFDDSQAWLGEVQQIMAAIGFMVTSFEWGASKISSDATLSEVALNRINGDTRDPVEQAFNAVRKSGNEVALRVLNSAAGDGRSTAFLTGCSSGDGNHSTITLYGFFGKVSKRNDNVLESGFKAGDEIGYCRIEAVLSDAIASRFRDVVKEKLGQAYDYYVKRVEF